MITPSEVNADRSLLRVIASKASATVLLSFIVLSFARLPARASSVAAPRHLRHER
jgi:hypothetical protein